MGLHPWAFFAKDGSRKNGGGERNRLIIRSLLTLTSIATAILLAWNLEESRGLAARSLRGGHARRLEELPRMPHTAGELTPKPVVSEGPILSGGEKSESKKWQQGHSANPDVETTWEESTTLVTPIATKDVYPGPCRKYTITLDLEKRRQRFAIDLQGRDAVLRVVPFPEAKQVIKLSRGDGRFDSQSSATVEFNGPRKAWMEVSLRRNADKAIVLLECFVESHSGPVPFTTTHLNRVRRDVEMSLRQCETAVHSMQNEKGNLRSWLHVNRSKLWFEKWMVVARLDFLSHSLPEAERQLSATAAELGAVDALLKSAHAVNGVRLQLVHAK